MKADLKKAVQIIGVALLCLLSYGSGYMVGRDELSAQRSKNTRVTNQATGQPKEVDFSLFWQAWKSVNDNYVGKVDEQEKVYGAISGMLSSLNDPYTVFLRPADSNELQEDLSGTFEGIGAEVAAKNGQIIIVTPLEGSPAEQSGIKAQDIIIAIDKKEAGEMGLTEAVRKIRGKAGTTVALSIMREGWTEPRDFAIKRDKITIKSVQWEMKEDNIAYIRLTQFGDDTGELLREAADEIVRKKPKGIIVDVRNNPGGLLNVAQDVTSLFIEPGVVLQRQFKDGRKIEDRTTLPAKFASYKVAVLVNGGSASASEIFAGALQDYKKGTLIGEKTFGKGSVQDLETLPGGAAIKITTAKWLTAKGRVVDGKGIEPDIKVEAPKDENDKSDPQLDRALQEVRK